MIKPTIHTNGTSGEELARLYGDARRAMLEAVNVLNLAAPNGRDYYPQGTAALSQAIGEHNRRARQLLAVHDEILTLEEHCHEWNARHAENLARARAR